MTLEEKATAKLLINPASAIKIADAIFTAHEPASTKEDWVLLNANLIENIGVSTWLANLLDVLTLPSEEYDGHEIVNPMLAVAVSEGLRASFSQSIKREEWIKANYKLMDEIGAAEWLWLLLEVLEIGEN